MPGRDSRRVDAAVRAAERARARERVRAHPRRGTRGVRGFTRRPKRLEFRGKPAPEAPPGGEIVGTDRDILGAAASVLDRLTREPHVLGDKAYYAPRTASQLRTIIAKVPKNRGSPRTAGAQARAEATRDRERAEQRNYKRHFGPVGPKGELGVMYVEYTGKRFKKGAYL